MKLATKRTEAVDGELWIVSRDLTRATSAVDIAPTMQLALDNWSYYYSDLQKRYSDLNEELIYGDQFFEDECESPLPHAYQHIQTNAYLNRHELAEVVRGKNKPQNKPATKPFIVHAYNHSYLGPYDSISHIHSEWGLDFQAELAVVTGDVPKGVDYKNAGQYIRLLMLLNGISVNSFIPNQHLDGMNPTLNKVAVAFSPVAVTVDELDDYWSDFKVNLPLFSYINGALFSQPNAAAEMKFDFASLISHAAKDNALRSGSIVGTGAVSNLRHSQGSSSVGEKRLIEQIEFGEPKTPFLQYGDEVHIEMFNIDGSSIFGAIVQMIMMGSANPHSTYLQV